jgi:hypothetical protein
MRPLQTLEEKERILNSLTGPRDFLFLEHDPVTECIRIEKTERGFKAGERFRLNEIV